MNSESPILMELQPLLDALCEETITGEQLARLEELVFAFPEARQHYIEFMSFQADLIGAIGRLPERALPLASASSATLPSQNVSLQTKASEPVKSPVASVSRPVEAPPSKSVTYPSTRDNEIKTTAATKPRKQSIWVFIGPPLALLLICGTIGTYHFVTRARASREVLASQSALTSSRDELAKVQKAQEIGQPQLRQELDAAIARERELAREYQQTLRDALKAIAEKEYLVRVTGPETIEPGAPNKWQIETLRQSGAIARAKQMEIVVKDEKDTALFRKSLRNTVGVTTLELPISFWTNVKPGTDLFLEVSASNFEPGEALAKLIDRIPLARPVYVTHLATDKPLYQPGETIRFRSLTLDRATLRPLERDMHLRFRLRMPGDTIVPIDEGNGRLFDGAQTILGPDNKPLRGIGVGEYRLPPDAPGGEYKLELVDASAGSGKKEILLETRKFIVNRYVPDTFEKKLEFDGKSYGAGDVVQARIEVSRTAGGPMKDARANVVATVDGKEFHTQPGERFTIVNDSAGTRAVLNVRFKLPADLFSKKDAPSASLSVNIQDGSDAEAIVRPIPLVTKTLLVEFYPEGGEMIEGVPGRVYFQVRTPQGKPADLKGIITDGTTTVAEAKTLTDAENPGVNRGHGVFMLTPKPGTKYFLKLQSPTGITEPTQSGYPLPEAKADGVALTALDTVTGRGEPVRVKVQVGQGSKKLHIGAYARGRLLSQQRVEVQAGKPVELTLAGQPSAGGVTRVTVFEELMGDDGLFKLVPVAERLTYRVPGEQLSLGVKPDRARYSPGDKVRLDLSATNERDQPVPAVLLVGVVNRSVITMADNKTDRLMPTHFLISGEVTHPSELEHADFLLTDHPKAAVALDLLLATQGWRRFAEQNGTAIAAANRKEVDEMLTAHGQISAPVELRKLEQQRVTAEFKAKIEIAALKTAEAKSRWQSVSTNLSEAVETARVNFQIADRQYESLSSELEEIESRFTSIPRALYVIVAAVLLIGWLGLIAATQPKTEVSKSPSTKGNALDLGVNGFLNRCLGIAIVSFLLFILYLGVTNLGTNANQAFSYVGSNIKAGRPDEFERAAALAPMAPPERMGKGIPAPKVDKNEIGQPNAPDTDVQAIKLPGLPDQRPVLPVPGPIGGDERPNMQAPRPQQPVYQPPAGPQFNPIAKADPKPELPVPDLAIHAAEPLRLDEAKNKKIRPNEQQDLGEALRKRREFAKGGANFEEDAIAQEMVQLPPFIVREYAHQRDPALGNVRSDFTETVYWHPVLVLPKTGKATIEFQLSDDIARYQVVVAGHTLDGRIGAITTTIEARKPFSIDPKLPLEISHTDRIDVPVRVTNDSDVQRSVDVVLTPNGFATEGKLAESIALGPNGKDRRIFRMKSNKLEGSASLVVEAASGADKDSIARTIRVVPDGFPGVGSMSDVLETRVRGTIMLPKDMVPGSLAVRLELYPTTMADLVKGLDGILREPYGCFEQTSTSNYPNIMVLDYLNQTNQADPQAARKAKQLLDKGYAKLTSFECPDTPLKLKQGFEWFGMADMAHEALSAYGLLQFKDMAKVHHVDPDLIKRTQAFLLSRRDGSGGFLRNARALDGFGGAPKHTTDAYIVWALVESDPGDNEKLDLRKEIEALKTAALKEDSVPGKDAYFVALTANIMLLRGDRETAFRLLDRLQTKHLKGGAVTGAVTSITRSGGRDLDIETTALTLLAWLRANDPTYAVSVKEATKWICQQRGGYGGFGSTQSTILALKALTLYAKKSAHPAESGEFVLKVGGKEAGVRKFTDKDVEVIALNIENPEALFKPGEKTEVEITTTAKQPYPFSLSYTYSRLTPASAEQCAVKIATKLAKAEASEGDTVPLNLTLENRQKQGQGMAVAIVGLPAGMKVPTDLKQLTELREKQQISFFEIRGRELILYWRELAPEQKIDLSIDLVCDVPGVYRGPASRGYLYYNADHKHWIEPLGITIRSIPK